MKRLSVIIVNYNSTDYLERCLAALYDATDEPSLAVTVIDNASDDQDFSHLQARFPEVDFIINPDNRGFSTACNQGIRALEAERYLFLNPDSEVKERALDLCLDFLAAHPEAGIVGCRVDNSDGTFQAACRRGIPRPSTALFRLLGLDRLFPRSRVFAGYHLGHLSVDETHEVEAVSGSFLMFRREVPQTSGLMDEDYFLYGEDLDFCFRAARHGWKIYYYPEARVVHHKGRSAARNPASRYHFWDAMEIFYRKHYQPQRNPLLNALVIGAIRLIAWPHRLRSG